MGRTWRTRLRNKRSTRGQCLSFERDVVELKRWMRSKTWSNSTNLKLYDFPGTGRGVCTKNGVGEGDILIEVPVEVMINCNVVGNSEIPKLIKSPLSMHELLALFLVLEKHKGIKSEWVSYVNSLPGELPDVPWLCRDEELRELPVEFREEVERKRSVFHESWEKVRRSIDVEAKCRCCGALMERVITEDLFTWSYLMVNTRSVHVDHMFGPKDFLIGSANMALCPFLDMFNHSDKANTTAEMTSDGQKYTLRTHNSYGNFEQIFISYGPHDNKKLLLEYGFYLPNNLYDVIPIKFEDTIKTLNKMNIKMEHKQYKYIMDKRFNEELNVNVNGPSFNLKALLYVVFNPDVTNWSTTIFTTGYTNEDEVRILEMIKILLSSFNLEETFESSSNHSSPMKNCVDYLNHVTQFRRRLVDCLLSNEIASDV